MRLSPNKRRLLLSHRRDSLESDEWLAAITMRDLERNMGAREWPMSTVHVAEPEPDESDRRPGDVGYAMELREIGDVLGCGVERVRQIQEQALRKLRHPSRACFLSEWRDVSPRARPSAPVRTPIAVIDVALARARAAELRAANAQRLAEGRAAQQPNGDRS
jgi:hypothetical protein